MSGRSDEPGIIFVVLFWSKVREQNNNKSLIGGSDNRTLVAGVFFFFFFKVTVAVKEVISCFNAHYFCKDESALNDVNVLRSVHATYVQVSAPKTCNGVRMMTSSHREDKEAF